MLGFRVIHLVAINEHDYVGVLLDRSGFPQVGVHRALVGALFEGTVELRQCDYRAVEFLGQGLQGSGDLGNLVGTVVTTGTGDLHQLQVVDHDQTDVAVLTHQTPGPRAHLGRADTGGVIDEQFAIVEQVDRRSQARPVIVFELAGTHLGLIDTAERGQHTHDQRFAWHLEGVHQHRLFAAQHGVFHQVHREGGLTHRRTTGDDDQVGRLQAAGFLVEIRVASGQAGDRVGGVEQGIDAVDSLGQQLVDADRATGLRPRFGDLEDLPFGFVEDFFGSAAFRVEGAVGDLGADADQLAQRRTLADDLRIGLDVGDGRRVFCQFAKIAEAADLRRLTFLVQLLGKGHDVDRRVLIGQFGDRTEDQAVVMSIEIAVGDLIEHAFPGVVVQHQTTEYGLFGLDGMRRHLQGSGLQIVLLGSGNIVHGHLSISEKQGIQKDKGHDL